MKKLHIFKAGKQCTKDGVEIEFTEADLAASAAAYDPAKHEAPLVVGHPQSNLPAYGWVQSSTAVGGDLFVAPSQVDASFAEAVRKGQFKKISASFYSPDSPVNPVPGVWYLRHVGFLGAQPPAVKGLRPVEFGEAEEGVVEFAEIAYETSWGFRAIARLLRSIKNQLIEDKGAETADKLLPEYDIEEVSRAAEAKVAAVEGNPSFAESEEEMKDLEAKKKELEEKAAEFSERETSLEAREKALKDKEEAVAKTKIQSEAADFAEGLVKAGKVLPKDKAGLVAYLSGETSHVDFAEEGKTEPGDKEAWLKRFLANLPPAVDYSERSGGGGPTGKPALTAAQLAEKAVEFMESEEKAGRRISSSAAVDRVLKDNSGE
jgi:hypothetical protein